MKKLKIGVIGLGFMGDLHANVYSTLPNVELVGIADKDVNKKELENKYNTKFYNTLMIKEARIEDDEIQLGNNPPF